MAGKTETEMVAVRMPRGLYRKVEAVAATENRTMTSVVLQAVTEYVGDTCRVCGGRVVPE